MSGTTFAFLVVMVVMCTYAFTTYVKEKGSKEDDAELDETLQKIDKLEERIRVLERIITENKFDLKKEIDSL